MRKELRPSVLGLSCVENYTLSILGSCFEDITCLFCMSFLSGNYLLDKIIKYEAEQNSFLLLPRIHEIAFEYLSLIELVSYDESELTNIWNKMNIYNQKVYYLLKVKQVFVRETLKAELIRNDHYICCWREKETNWVFNDYPYKLITLNNKELWEAYNGNIIVFNIVKKIDVLTKEMSYSLCKKNVRYCVENIKNIDIGCLENIKIEQVKEFLIIYKKILQREWLYCKARIKSSTIFYATFRLVDNLLTKIYIDELKRRENNVQDYIKDLYQILSQDNFILECMDNI